MRDLTESYPEQRDALRDALERAVVDKLDRYGIYTGDDCIHEVSARSYDGFIAHTNGGFRVLVPCTLRDVEYEGLTDFEESTLRGYIDRSYSDAAREWLEDGDAPDDMRERWNDSVEPIDAWEFAHREIDRIETEWRDRYANPDAPELPGIEPATRPVDVDMMRESLWEICDGWLTEGSTFFYEITAIFYEAGHRRNNTGADEVYIFAGINTDFEYGREKGLETVDGRDFKLARLTPKRIDAIVDALVNKI